MKHKLLTALFIGFVLITNAQQLQTSSMYDLQGILQNPSTAGVQENNNVGVSYRSQWAGISGSPRTATLYGSFNFPKQSIGIGGYIYNDKTGPTSRTGIDLSLAKHIVWDRGIFSLGLQASLLQYSLDMTKLSATLGNDPVLAGGSNKIKYDVGFGMSYTTKKFQIGASVLQLIQSKLDFYTGNLTRTESGKLYRHYYLHALYNWHTDESTVITPNALFIYMPNSPSDFQLGARVEHKKLFWWGVGYRFNQSFMLSAGIHVSKAISIGYSFDDYIAPISNFDNGSSAHEVLLRYNFVK